jgi:hypothetical protein
MPSYIASQVARVACTGHLCNSKQGEFLFTSSYIYELLYILSSSQHTDNALHAKCTQTVVRHWIVPAGCIIAEQQLSCEPIALLAAGSSKMYMATVAVNNTGTLHINASAQCSRDQDFANNAAQTSVSVLQTCAHFNGDGSPYLCEGNYEYNSVASNNYAPSQGVCCTVSWFTAGVVAHSIYAETGRTCAG